jgi:hypothetical protein
MIQKLSIVDDTVTLNLVHVHNSSLYLSQEQVCLKYPLASNRLRVHTWQYLHSTRFAAATSTKLTAFAVEAIFGNHTFLFDLTAMLL